MLHAPFSPLDRAAVCVSTRAVVPRPAPRRRFTLRLPERRDARCVGPTSAVSIPSYEHPRLAGSRMGRALFTRASPRDRLVHASAIRFGGPHVRPFSEHRPRLGVVFPIAVRAVSAPLTPLSPPPGPVAVLAHHPDPRRPPRPFLPRPREARCAAETIRGVFRRPRTFAPQRPFERPAPDFPGVAAWPPLHRFSTPFHLPAIPGDVRAGQAPVHAHRCQRLARFSWALDAACRLLQPVTIRGHTLRAIDPRTRVELAPHCSPAPTDAGCVGLSVRRRTEDQRATVRTRRLSPSRSTCVDESNRGPKRRSEGESRVLRTIRAGPPL